MFRAILTVAFVAALCGVCPAGEPTSIRLAPIQKVYINNNRALEVNDQVFFPLMAWLQDAKNFQFVRACGMNTVAGYWPKSSGTRDVTEYIELVRKAGLYGVMPYHEGLKGHPALLGYIHDDEPDLPHQVSDAEIVPDKSLKINPRTPLWRIVDGVPHTWSVLDPLQGASITIRLPKPVTAESVAVWLTISKGLPVAKQVSFAADGREVLKVELANKSGQQKFLLPKPVTFKELTFTVHSTYPNEHDWGSVGEIEAFDSQGKNVVLSPPRQEPRMMPDKVMEKYRSMKASDPSRPVFMTLTGYFHPHFQKWTDQQRQSLYPHYIKATDIVGYDIYPIYGWNKPEWIHLVYEATGQLVEMAGKRPVYAWIETSKGSQWTGPLEKQKDVTPAHIRAQVWMAICNGATAIGYFTHVWQPAYSQFGVPEENRKALAEINAQITRLATAILADAPRRRVAIKAEDDTQLALLARQHDGALYLFAVNYDQRMRTARATISVEGLPEGSEVTVIDESRTIKAEQGRFGDVFAPLGVHIYRIVL